VNTMTKLNICPVCGISGKHAPECRLRLKDELLATLADYLEEAHEAELSTNHFGDGRKGCTYCDAIRDARKMLKGDK
jgi:hypothetical protein